MTKSTSFALGDHFAGFIEEQISQGRYASASEVLRAGLRLLEDQEAKGAALRAAIVEGLASGPSTAFDIEEFLEEMDGRKP